MKRLLVALLVWIAAYAICETGTQARELRVTEEEVYCLALNDYYEARGEDLNGRFGVAFVVINRLASRLYPKTVCEVVFQQSSGKCAFSWVCNRYPIREEVAWSGSMAFARTFLKTYKQMQDPTSGAIHYHEHSIIPKWAKDYEYNIVIGDHVFYPKQVTRR